jgi:hypothetical protein
MRPFRWTGRKGMPSAESAGLMGTSFVERESRVSRPTMGRVKQIATIRASQIAARYGEHAPMATACCNACRTCVQTNALGIAMAGVASLGVAIRRRLRKG